MSTPFGQLLRLAGLYGIQTAYFGADGRRRRAPAGVLLATLSALGAPVARLGDVPDALRARRVARAGGGLDPFTVAWDGRRGRPALALPLEQAQKTARCRIVREDGGEMTWTVVPARLRGARSEVVEGATYLRAHLSLPGPLPPGYHRLEVDLGQQSFAGQVVSAPIRAWEPPEGAPGLAAAGRFWGAFLPLYAARSERTWGCGDFGELEALGEWVGELGGGVLATLPLLPAYLDELYNPSPYAPVSRLFWNELYLDVGALPELRRCPPAQALLASPGFREEVGALQGAPLVDYRRAMALKRRVLELLAEATFSDPSGAPEGLPDGLRSFLARPYVQDYARFRAAGERLRTPWTAWPQTLRDAPLGAGAAGGAPILGGDGAGDAPAYRYHLYCQWAAQRQMSDLDARARERGLGLYLDFPLGANPDGFDVWRERESFALGVRAGAPPDMFFTGGQDWGFPPLHPERCRARGYGYYIAALRQHLRHAGMLRLDHVMGFHRLYWIPEGVSARDGVYVRYPAQDFYAILALESQRSRTLLVGENLGTVPRAVNPALARHNVRGMYVLQYSVSPDPQRTPGPVPAGTVAGLNTHDAPPFGAFWEALDVDDQLDLGLLDGQGAAGAREYRRAVCWALAQALQSRGLLEGAPDDPRAVLDAALVWLSLGPPAGVLVNLEDLWLERQPQNVPGTWQERPNWMRPARYERQVFTRLPQVLKTLRKVDAARRRPV